VAGAFGVGVLLALAGGGCGRGAPAQAAMATASAAGKGGAGAGGRAAAAATGTATGSGTAAVSTVNGLPPAAYSPENPPPAWNGPLPYPILIADEQNDRILEVTPDKRIVWQWPSPETTAQSRSYGTSGDDAFFSPDGTKIVTNDEDGSTILRIDYYTGQVDWHFGVPEHAGSDLTHLNYPDDAYLLPNGNTMVADIRNCRELTIGPDQRVVAVWGKPQKGYCQTDPAKGLFGYPNGDTPQPDGDILMTFISGNRIALLSPTGSVIWNVRAPDLHGGYVSDAQLLPNGDVVVAGYGKPGTVVEFDPKSGRVVWEYYVTSGDGELDHPSYATELPNGNFLLNDDANDRVIVIDRASKKIVWQYGQTGVRGKAAGLLNWPDGVDLDLWRDWLHFSPPPGDNG
jgi:outer membrane protein assembly factor BamB